MFRVNWVSNLTRSRRGSRDVAKFRGEAGARACALVDIREEADLMGPLGYIQGSDWVPEAGARSLGLRIDEEEPVILLSNDGDRSGAVTRDLERGGLRLV